MFKLHRIIFVFLFCSHSVSFAEIKIGWIGPLTGNAAVLGVDSVPAIQIAIDQVNASGGINGEMVRLVVEDDQYLTSKTVAAYNQLVHHQGIKILFVLTYGGLFAIAPKAEKDGVIIIDSLDCDEKIAKFQGGILCIAKTTESMGRGLADLIISRGDLPTGLIYFDGDPFMGILADSMIERLKNQGVGPKVIETYNESTTDFRPISTRIKASGDLRSVVLLGYDQLGNAARSLRELGVKAQFYGVNTATSTGFQKLAGSAIDGMIGASFYAERVTALKEFERAFIAKVGRSWQFETSTLPSYDAMQIILSILKAGSSSQVAQPLDTGVILKHLLNTRDYRGISGKITIDADGATRSIGVVPMKLEKGVLVPLSSNS